VRELSAMSSSAIGDLAVSWERALADPLRDLDSWRRISLWTIAGRVVLTVREHSPSELDEQRALFE
jgi:hypothetical protein